MFRLGYLNQDHQNLVFKYAGRMKAESGEFKTYTITGLASTDTGFGPVSGSAYANADSTIIHASYTVKFTGLDLIGFYELIYYPETEGGYINYRFELDSVTTISGSDTFDVIDCDTFG